jgi:hypothetical protein
MLSIKLFRLVFCLFWFNRNIETLCFSIEAKLKQTVLKQTKINPKKNETKYALYHTVHRNSLFRYRTERTETNVLFRIVIVSDPYQFRLFQIETSFEGHPRQAAATMVLISRHEA